MEMNFRMIANPFSVDENTVPQKYQLEIIDLKTNFTFCDLKREPEFTKQQFYKMMLPQTDYPAIKTLAQRTILMFSSTFICEHTFSRMKQTKTGARARLTDENLHSFCCGCKYRILH
jgi:hypothetical protein